MIETTQTKPEFEILNQYIKDLSFEAPSSPKIFFEKIEEKPNMEIGLEIKSIPVNETLCEVVINLKVKNILKDNVLYMIDLSYGAMVALHTEDKDIKSKHILKTVPSYLFPFVRGLIASITKDSGFMTFILDPINFDNIKAVPQPVPETEVQPAANDDKKKK